VLKKGELDSIDRRDGFDFFFPEPRRELTARYRKKYFYVFHDKVALIKTSFGCPYRCNFCFCRKITGDRYFERPLEDVINELKKIKEKEIYIVDDDFLFSRERISRFIHMLKDSNLDKRFLVYGRSDFIINHADLIRDFKEVGLRTIIIGLESFKNEELEGYNKKSSSDTNEKAMDILNRYGVDCYAAIIIPPHWGESDFKLLRSKLKKLRIKFINLQPLTPLPGTGIQVEEDKLVIQKSDYPRWDLAHVTLKPEKMGLPEFYRHIIRVYQSVAFRPSNIIGHLKYPLHMHWRLFKGLIRLSRQYKRMYREALHYA
jgi:radical SAM superfamily enzyme YgiQ (UPF0313 family)